MCTGSNSCLAFSSSKADTGALGKAATISGLNGSPKSGTRLSV
jgi:hypothetical protein